QSRQPRYGSLFRGTSHRSRLWSGTARAPIFCQQRRPEVSTAIWVRNDACSKERLKAAENEDNRQFRLDCYGRHDAGSEREIGRHTGSEPNLIESMGPTSIFASS